MSRASVLPMAAAFGLADIPMIIALVVTYHEVCFMTHPLPRSLRERIGHALAFEGIAVLICAPAMAWFMDKPLLHLGVLVGYAVVGFWVAVRVQKEWARLLVKSTIP